MATFYNYILRNKRDNTWFAKRREETRVHIKRIYDDINRIFVAAKIAAVMKEEGHRISVDMVRQLMRDIGLIRIRQDTKDLYDKEQCNYKNYLNQQFTATRPGKVLVRDVTYFRFNKKNFYICVLLDLFAQRIVRYDRQSK